MAEKQSQLEQTQHELTDLNEEIVTQASRPIAIEAHLSELGVFNALDLTDESVRQSVIYTLCQLEVETQAFMPEFDICALTRDEISEEIKANVTFEAEEENQEVYELFLDVGERLRENHEQNSSGYIDAFLQILNDEAVLQSQLGAIAVERGLIANDDPKALPALIAEFYQELSGSEQFFEFRDVTSQNLLALQTMSGASPEYAELVSTSGVDVTDRSAVQSFVLTSGFLEDDDIDQETKDEVIRHLGIEPFRDATDMFNTLDAIEANGGYFQNADGQTVQFNQRNGVPMGRYSLYPDENQRNGFVAKVTVGGRTLRLHFNRDTDPNLVDEMVSSAMIAQVLANRDFQVANRFILGGDGLAAQGVTDIRLDEYQVKRAEQLYGAFMGFGTELRTGFPNQSDLIEFERRLQATHIDGDAKTGDNTGRGDQSWREIGMLDEQDDINMNRVEEVGAYINRNPISLPKYQTLVEKFGNRSTARTSIN